MRVFPSIAISLSILVSCGQSQTLGEQETIRITRGGAQPSQPVPVDHFTGSVRIDSSFQTSAPAANLRSSGFCLIQAPEQRGTRIRWGRL